ncbi:MAG: hypothetical protein WBC44_01610 [Planctomycetaceae bacterium]
MRVYEYAETRSLENQQVLDAAKKLKIDAGTASSGLSDEEVERLDGHFTAPADDSDEVTNLPEPAVTGSESDALRKRIAELEARLAEAESKGPASPAVDDAAFAKSPKHTKSFAVKVIAGPKRGTAPETITNCCDESEAIRRYAARYNMTTSEHRFQVAKVDADGSKESKKITAA